MAHDQNTENSEKVTIDIGKVFESVQELFESHLKKPLTALEITLLVNKARGPLFKEIKSLMKHDMIERLEVRLDPEARQVLVFYRRKKE